MQISKNIITVSLVIYILMIFAVLFDPSELALGSGFVTLPSLALAMAQGLGNIMWIGGTGFMVVLIFSFWLLLDNGAFQTSLTKSIENGTMGRRQDKVYGFFLLSVGLMFSLVALGSGFWFTGFFWFTGLIVAKALSIKIHKTDEFKDYVENSL